MPVPSASAVCWTRGSWRGFSGSWRTWKRRRRGDSSASPGKRTCTRRWRGGWWIAWGRRARSRNDQVSADLRLLVMDETGQVLQLLGRLMGVILDKAEAYLGAVMPGYTHLQPAQPVLLSHHLLAYFEMFKRDTGRFVQARRSADACPLGSGALAGVTFPLNRRLMAEELGFSHVTANSMDAVSDRDFVLDFLHACVTVMSHLSRLGEEIVLWCSPAFGFVVLDEAFATGSSMMPQKMNPDVAELVRAKGGRVLGSYVALAHVLKGLPLTYNRDLQEDKENLFDALDQVKGCLRVMAEMLARLEFRVDVMRRAAGDGYTNATDLADYLTRKGLPF
ncbi:MAG: argininosuccinate lyase, partial [Candidatus Geothermincolales bacterium]